MRLLRQALFLVALAMPTAALADGPTLEERAAVIRPQVDELLWRAVPWHTDLMEAVKVARAEQRPLFIWATADDPLQRC